MDRLIQFALHPSAPFRLDLTAWAIRRRPENQIDRWDGEFYERVLAVGDRPVLIRVAQTGSVDAPRLNVSIFGSGGDVKAAAAAALNRLLGLQIDVQPFYRLAAQNSRLHELAERFRGLRPPRFPTIWEAVVNGITCQQFSLHVGILMLNRLATRFGLGVERPDGVQHAFPRPADLAAAATDALRSLGLNGAKTRALIELGHRITSGELDLECFEDLDNAQAVSRLVELRGIGRWTAEYTLLRGMGRLDLFPGDDIGARNNLLRWMKLRPPLDYNRVARLVAKWQPYAGFIYFHLLLDSLARAGYLPSPERPTDERNRSGFSVSQV